MNRRCNLVVAALLLTTAVAGAQTVVIAPVGGPDPYAMAPTSTNPYLWGNGFAAPTTTWIRDRVWVSADYLYWWTDGMDTLPLVTSSPAGTAPNQAGVLGLADTTVLYGGNKLNDGSTNGLRLRSGWWFRQGTWAIESEFYRLKSSTESFGASGDGSSILARPYFDIVAGSQASRLISYPGRSAGSVAVSSQSRLQSGLINLRASLIPIGMLGCNDGCDPPDRVDWIVGYRVLELTDDLSITDSRTSLIPGNNESRISGDSFSTKNSFSGLQLGVMYQAHYQRLWMESMIRVALGDNRQTANILGGTTITNGASNSYTGGLLAQSSNIGNFEQNEFTMIPELGLNFGIRITRCLHATIGYTVLYFPNVLRASEQIDADINPSLIPPGALLTGALRPQYQPVQDDYWAHGLNFGAELKF